MAPCSPANSSDISEKHIASILKVKEYAKQETVLKQAATNARCDSFSFFLCLSTCSMPYFGFRLGLLFDNEDGSEILLLDIS
jgi:hypothetical protein